MKYKLTNDYEIVPVSSTGGARTQTMNEYLKMKREVEAYLKNGKSPQKGGFLFDLVKAVGTMVKNGVEHKPAFEDVLYHGSGANDVDGGFLDLFGKMIKKGFEHNPAFENVLYHGSGVEGGFLLDLVKAVGTMVKNGVEHKPAFKGIFGKGKTSGLTKPKRKVSAKMKQRGELIKQVMKKHKVTLPQASKMLKEAGY